MFSNEDVTIGAWMLAMNVNHENNRHLCESECTPSFISVWDIPKCSGWELLSYFECSSSFELPAVSEVQHKFLFNNRENMKTK